MSVSRWTHSHVARRQRKVLEGNEDPLVAAEQDRGRVHRQLHHRGLPTGGAGHHRHGPQTVRHQGLREGLQRWAIQDPASVDVSHQDLELLGGGEKRTR